MRHSRNPTTLGRRVLARSRHSLSDAPAQNWSGPPRPTATLTKTDRLVQEARTGGDELPYFDYLHVERFPSGSTSFVRANYGHVRGRPTIREAGLKNDFLCLNRFSSAKYSYFASPMSMEICNHLTQVRMVLSRRTKGAMRLPRRLEFLVGTV